MPRIYLHTEEDIYNTYSGSELIRHKRAYLHPHSCSVRPLILLILLCTFGPCLLKCLSTFIESKMDSLETLVLESQNALLNQKYSSTYQLVPQDNVSEQNLFTMS
ncbi:hypothetical protein E2320_023010, partial [Naja naja]